MNEQPLPTLAEIHIRMERILRGEDITAPVAAAGSIPGYYGSEHPYFVWSRMWEKATPVDDAFYQAGVIGWASRD